MDEPQFEVRGGAGPYEVAAIVAAVNRVLAEEEVKAVRPPPRRQHPWVLIGRMRQPPPPLYTAPVGAADGWGLDVPDGDAGA